MQSRSQSVESIFKRTRSKTVARKGQNINNNCNKRKLDECDVDENNDNEPNKKKRKIDEKNTNNKLNSVFESNGSLEKRNNAITKKRDRYKQKSNKWKSKYMKL